MYPWSNWWHKDSRGWALDSSRGQSLHGEGLLTIIKDGGMKKKKKDGGMRSWLQESREESHSRSRDLSCAAFRYFFFLSGHREGGGRGRWWNLEHFDSLLSTYLVSWEGPCQFWLSEGLRKWLQNLSPKAVHFWKGKRTLVTMKLDKRLKLRPSQKAALSRRLQGTGDC